jgi:serine/threonine-protein kinase
LGPSTALQQTSTADSQAAVVASQQHANRPVRRPPPKVPASATTPVPPAVKGAPAPGGASDCTIRISSKPWAEIWIDGKNTGRKTPVDNMKIACGTRKLELKRPDQDMEQMEMLKVVPGKPFRGNYELE